MAPAHICMQPICETITHSPAKACISTIYSCDMGIIGVFAC